MTPRPEPSRGLSRPLAHPGLTIMGDPEDDDEEEEKEKKKREEDEDEEGNDGEDDEEPWKVNSQTRISISGRTTKDGRGLIYFNKCVSGLSPKKNIIRLLCS